MKRFKAHFFIVVVCLSTLSFFGFASVPVVRLQGEHLTLNVKDQPLADILKMLSDQGVRIRIDPRINPMVTATFTDRPIGAAIAGLLKTVDYALIWRKDKSSTDTEPTLWEIRIFYKGQEARVQPLKKSDNLTVVKKDNGVFFVKDILLVRLDPNMPEAALAGLLDRLGATIIDFYAPLGIVRLRLPHGSDVPAIADAIVDTPGIRGAEPDYAYPLEGGIPAPIESASTIAAAVCRAIRRQ